MCLATSGRDAATGLSTIRLQYLVPELQVLMLLRLMECIIKVKKTMVRICHGCQEVTAATSDTQPPAVPGSGAAGGGGK